MRSLGGTCNARVPRVGRDVRRWRPRRDHAAATPQPRRDHGRPS